MALNYFLCKFTPLHQRFVLILDLMQELEAKLKFYGRKNVLAPETQPEVNRSFGESALTVTSTDSGFENVTEATKFGSNSDNLEFFDEDSVSNGGFGFDNLTFKFELEAVTEEETEV